MRSTKQRSLQTLRGIYVEKIIEKKYGGSRTHKYPYDCFDIVFEPSENPFLLDALVEVKSTLSWYFVGRSKRKHHRVNHGRYIINIENHKKLIKIAERLRKEAFYVFVLIPRYDNGKSEEDYNKWKERWMSWEEVNELCKKCPISTIKRDYGTLQFYLLSSENVFKLD